MYRVKLKPDSSFIGTLGEHNDPVNIEGTIVSPFEWASAGNVNPNQLGDVTLVKWDNGFYNTYPKPNVDLEILENTVEG